MDSPIEFEADSMDVPWIYAHAVITWWILLCIIIYRMMQNFLKPVNTLSVEEVKNFTVTAGDLRGMYCVAVKTEGENVWVCLRTSTAAIIGGRKSFSLLPFWISLLLFNHVLGWFVLLVVELMLC